MENLQVLRILVIFLMSINTGYSQLASKDIFQNDTYPKGFVFRFVSEKTQNYSDYSDWEANLVHLDGFIGKLFVEELTVFDTAKSASWFNQFAVNHPEKIVMVHLNGRARDPRMNNNTLYSAGHWMYHPGTSLTQNITALQTTFTVADASVFKMNFGNGGADRDDDIVIVPLDGSNNRLWNQAEQVQLVAINGNQITVNRGQYGTTAKAFNSGVYLAPHAVGGPWNNNNLVWLYNYAVDGPVDGSGKRCIDVFSDEVSGWFNAGGLLESVDGIQFDIARRYVDERNNREVDQNNDGIGDNASPELREKYELGVVEFYKALRTKMGTEKLIIGDGGRFDNQRAASAINGIESEGFGDTNDTYKQFSKSINAFNYFTSVSNIPKFSYVTHKDIESTTEDEYRKRERFVLASSQCLGIAFNSFVREYPRFNDTDIVIQDELIAGDLATPHWLGAPLADYVDLSENTPDFWSGNGLATLMTSTSKSKCIISQFTSRLRVSIKENEKEATVTFKDVTVPSGNFVFSFEAKAVSKLDDLPEETPRLIKIEILGGSSYDNDAQEILGFFSTDKRYKTSYYVRDIGTTTVDIKLTIEGDDKVDLYDFKLRPTVQALARAFENGVVLSNPSINSYTFNLAELFPGRSFKRLTATNGHDNVVNNGVDAGSQVSVPALDGLFLLDKNPTLGNHQEGIDLNNRFVVFPNPTNGLLNISLPMHAKDLSVTAYDLNGRLVFRKAMKKQESNTIEISHLSKGLYVLKVSGSDFSYSKIISK